MSNLVKLYFLMLICGLVLAGGYRTKRVAKDECSAQLKAVNSLQEQLTKARNDLFGVQTQLDAEKANLDNLNSQASKLQNQIDANLPLANSVSSLQGQVASVSTKIADLKAQNAVDTAALAGLNNQLSNLKATRDSNVLRKGELESSVANSKKAVESARNAVADLKDALADARAALAAAEAASSQSTSQLNALDNKISVNNDRVARARKELEDALAEQAALAQSRSTVSATLSALQSQIANVRSNIAGLSDKLVSAQNTYDGAVATYNQNVNALNQVVAAIEKLDNQIAQTQAQVANLQSTIADQLRNLAGLNAQLQSLQAQLDAALAAQRLVADLRVKLDGILSAIAKSKANIAALNARCAEISRTIADLQYKFSCAQNEYAECVKRCDRDDDDDEDHHTVVSVYTIGNYVGRGVPTTINDYTCGGYGPKRTGSGLVSDFNSDVAIVNGVQVQLGGCTRFSGPAKRVEVQKVVSFEGYERGGRIYATRFDCN